MSGVSIHSGHGELKRHLAELVGTDPSRYASDMGTERHKRLTAAEIDAVADALGLGFLDASKQEVRDAIMLKLGRDHRTGVRMWDASDLVAVIERLEQEHIDGGGPDVRTDGGLNRARVRQRRDADSVRQHAGVGEQGRCPHGVADCNGLNGPGLSCARCFFGGGGDD